MEKEKKSQNGKKNLLEWTVFAVSVLLLMTMISFLVYKTYVHKPSPPDIVVSFRPEDTATSLYQYHLLVRNIGGETAAEVIVELNLMEQGKSIEKAEVQLEFVPKLSKRESWVSFTNDPSQADSLYARVVSFKKP